MFHTPPHKLDPSLPQAGQTTSRPYEGDPRVLTQHVCGKHGYVVGPESLGRCKWCAYDDGLEVAA